MNENSFTVSDEDDLWIIPLHGASVPLPPMADLPASNAPQDLSTSDFIAGFLDVQSDDVPTDVGFQPRLRRSA